MSRRSSLKSVQRASYGGASEREGSVGDSDRGLQTERSEQAEVGSFCLNRGRKVYELKNHPSTLLRTCLGNVLAVVSDVKLGVSTSSMVDYYIADVVEMTDYEPFGMELAGRHWVSGSRYRFGFNGKESDDEWSGEGNMVDFGARVYDSRLGKWLSLDPFARKYAALSPYQYSGNSPIMCNDPNGKEIRVVSIERNKEGKITKVNIEISGKIVMRGSYNYKSEAAKNQWVADFNKGIQDRMSINGEGFEVSVVSKFERVEDESKIAKEDHVVYLMSDYRKFAHTDGDIVAGANVNCLGGKVMYATWEDVKGSMPALHEVGHWFGLSHPIEHQRVEDLVVIDPNSNMCRFDYYDFFKAFSPHNMMHWPKHTNAEPKDVVELIQYEIFLACLEKGYINFGPNQFDPKRTNSQGLRLNSSYCKVTGNQVLIKNLGSSGNYLLKSVAPGDKAPKN